MPTQPPASLPSAAEQPEAAPLPLPEAAPLPQPEAAPLPQPKPPSLMDIRLAGIRASNEATAAAKKEHAVRTASFHAAKATKAAAGRLAHEDRYANEDANAKRKRLDVFKHTTHDLVRAAQMEHGRMAKRAAAECAEHVAACDTETARLDALARAEDKMLMQVQASQTGFMQRMLLLDGHKHNGTSVASANQVIGEARAKIEDGREVLDRHKSACEHCSGGEVCLVYARLYQKSATYRSEIDAKCASVPGSALGGTQSAPARKQAVQRKHKDYYRLMQAKQEHMKGCSACKSNAECVFNVSMELGLKQFTAEAQHKDAVEEHEAGCAACLSGKECLSIPVRHVVAMSTPGVYRYLPQWSPHLQEHEVKRRSALNPKP